MDNIRRMCTTAETVRFPTVTDKLVVGDSHAICMYRPGWTVHSVPYKTLHGALEIGLQKLVEEVAPVYQFKEIEFYFGNIDVRHHIFRQDHPYAAIMGLAQRYADQVNDFHKFGIRPSVYELLPIEDESRKLPTTGLYKGKPFYGSWGERNDARLAFRNYLRNRVYLKEWVGRYLNVQGQLDFKYMEQPHSVHLSREFYPYWQGEVGTNPVGMKPKVNRKPAGGATLAELFS